jgi:ABC-type bacteriocin/lantibiotic exporter with double-glycine peptidase domain/CRP-like cAMP-binding protein
VTETGVLDDLPVLRFLPEDTRALVVRHFVPASFPFGGVLASEGDPTDALYVLVSGRARVIKHSETNDEIPLNILRAGDSFGEVELLDGLPRPATVRASSDVIALRLERSTFVTLADRNPDIRTYLELQSKHQQLQAFFRGFPAFARLPPEALVAIVLAELESRTFSAGEIIVRQGDPPGPMFLIEEGSVRVVREDDGKRTYVGTLGTGDYFGEVAALAGVARGATVEATTPIRALTLAPETVRRLAEALPDFRARLEERIGQYSYKQRAQLPDGVEQEILPAGAEAQAQVGDEQTDHHETDADAVEEQPFESEGRFVKRRQRVRRMRFVRQIDEMDCGAASLAMIARHFGRDVPLARIRQLVNTGLDGTSLRSICTAGEELGLAARPVKASHHHLDRMPLPAICHWDGEHWLVLYRVTRRHAHLADPARGFRRVSRDEFSRRWTGYTALFDYTPAFEQTPQATPGLGWLWAIIKPHTPLLLRALALAAVVSVLQMVLPVFTQVIVDRVLVEQDLSLLNLLIVAMGATMAFIVASLLAQRYLLSFVAVRIDAAGLDFITRRLLALPMSYFATRRTGDLQRRIEGMRLIRDLLVQNGIAGITAVVQLAVTVALMSVYSPWLTAVFLTTAPLYAMLMLVANRWLRPTFYDLEDSYGRYHSYQVDAIKGIETVKAIGGEPMFRRLMLGQFQRVADKSFRADFMVMTYAGAAEAITFLGLGLFLWAGANQVLAGRLTIGGLVAFNSLLTLATVPLHNVLLLWDILQRATVMLTRLDDVFEQEPEQGHDRSRLRPVRGLTGHVSFRNVGFRYGGPEAPAILQDITLEVPAGKRVAIVGRSGSGKTTLVKCLAGLLEPTDGAIQFDGLDLKTLNYRDLRRHIGFVLQDSYVFADTIGRNIAFGEDEPDMDRIIWASKAASADEFIQRLPFGYDTRIGETGIALSGGQKQRIAIARALYHKPPILVFDEATSSLDTESERSVQQNIDGLLKGRTSFIVAHRLSTVRGADVILVLERGKLVERGTHDELMRRQGLYYYLASQQLGVA